MSVDYQSNLGVKHFTSGIDVTVVEWIVVYALEYKINMNALDDCMTAKGKIRYSACLIFC